jgi:hypothetical protein
VWPNGDGREEERGKRGVLRCSQNLNVWNFGRAPTIYLRFSNELAAVVRVHLQNFFLAMTPISGSIAACQRAVQLLAISPCIALAGRGPMAAQSNIREGRAVRACWQ